MSDAAAAQCAQARVPTTMAARYLGQICKHFAHRLPVSQEGATGRITFPATGVCHLAAHNGELVLLAAAPNADALARVEDVITRHLTRFAFRETLDIAWTPPTV